MKKAIAMKWAKALESGKYQQGTGRLHNVNKDQFCCLGVLCDIVKKDVSGSWMGSEFITLSGGSGVHAPPCSVVEFAGLKAREGQLTYGKIGHTSLMSFNDSRRFSFKKIASIIRRRYKDL